MLKINDIYKNLRTNIPKNILSGNSKIIVGFSGGPDSRLLIDFLCRSIQNPEKNIIATHVNYKLREKDSQKDEDLVTDICKKENIKLEKFIHPLKNETKGIQEKARIIRLNIFNELSIKYKTNKIFLGHNYNDHIETIFLNIIRGTGLKGLEGIKSNKKKGKVVGINTQIKSNSRQNSGVGFAVPINLAKQVVPSIINGKSHLYSYLGINALNLDYGSRIRANVEDNFKGVLILDVLNEGPAHLAGIKGDSSMQPDLNYDGDIITKIDTYKIDTFEDLMSYLALNTEAGDIVKIEVVRDYNYLNIDVMLQARPD